MHDIDLISEPPHAPSPQIYISKVKGRKVESRHFAHHWNNTLNDRCVRIQGVGRGTATANFLRPTGQIIDEPINNCSCPETLTLKCCWWLTSRRCRLLMMFRSLLLHGKVPQHASSHIVCKYFILQYYTGCTGKKKKLTFSSYKRKFRWERLQSHIWGRAS